MLLLILETAVPIVAFLLMVAVGLDVTRAGLRRIAADLRLLVTATLAQAALLPAAAVLVTSQLQLSPRITEFLLLVAACPGGGMSNVYVYLARANTALSVTLTAISCLCAAVTLPLVLFAYGLVLDRPFEFSVPLPTLVGQLLIMAVIPVSLGAWVRDRRPDLERRHGGQLRMLSAFGVIAIVAAGLAQSAGSFSRDLIAGGAVAAALAVMAAAFGWLAGVLLRVPAPDRFTLLVEFAVRNLAIAMVLEVSLLHHPDFVPFGALALFGQAALLGVAVQLYRAHRRRATA